MALHHILYIWLNNQTELLSRLNGHSLIGFEALARTAAHWPTTHMLMKYVRNPSVTIAPKRITDGTASDACSGMPRMSRLYFIIIRQ